MSTAGDDIFPLSRLGIVSVTYYLVIPHPTDARVLLLPDNGGWTLPGWAGPAQDGGAETPIWHDPAPVDRALRDRFGLNVWTLRCLHADLERRLGKTQFVYETESAPANWTAPTGSRWVGHGDLRGMRVNGRGHLGVLGRWFIERDDPEAAARRPPWYKPGWHDDAIGWIDSQLTRRGLTATAPPEQIRSRERSCEIRVETTGGLLRFKAVPPVHAHEPALTEFLAQAFPGQVPAVLARDDARHWMLMVDHGDDRLADVHDVEQWGNALRRFAQLQIACIPHIAKLRALGVPVRPVRELPRKMDALLADAATWSERNSPNESGQPVGPITEGEIASLRTLVPFLASSCKELARSAVPDTLEHGNVWPEYVTPVNGDYVFSDWSDSALSHPFANVAPFLLMGSQTFDDPDIRDRLRDAYLKPWATFAPKQELDRLFALAFRVAPLQYAIMYYRDLLPSMDARWEKEFILRRSLRLLLDQHREAQSHSERSRRTAPATRKRLVIEPQRRDPPQGAGGPDIDALLRILGT